MKKALVIVLLAVLSLGTRAAGYDYLVFTMTDGQTKVVAASNLTFTFSDTELTVSNGSQTLETLSLGTLQKMEFSVDGTSGIHTITADTLTTDGSAVIYDMNGRQMPSGTALPQGVYIVKTPNRTFKVQMR